MRSELEREQFRGELLVGGVQLALAALLAALVAATPPGYAPGAPIEAAPLGLAFFALLALLRLYAAWTGQLSAPVLAAGVVGEMLVLLFVIWAYHLQYEQPPPLALKSTEFVFVFALVALRTLRFEPAWVLVSGLTAALGWLVLVALAIAGAPESPTVTSYDLPGSIRRGTSAARVCSPSSRKQ